MATQAALLDLPVPPSPQSTTLPLRGVLAYALPVLGVGFMWNMTSFYFLKFSTDVLLISPGLMGLIFGAARIWDAISDPMAGYWSDRTRSRLGRRRPWMLASALPLAIVFFCVWWQPPGLDGGWRVVWVAGSILAFYTALTAFRIPHVSLGAELTRDYHDRTRVFAATGVLEALGGIVGVAALALLVSSGDMISERAAQVAAAVSFCSIVLIAISVAVVREPVQHQGRGADGPRQAVRDVAGNPHALRLLAANLLQSLGVVCAATSLPYLTEYVLGDARLLPTVLMAFIVPALVTMPLWAPLSRRFGKREVWIGARGIQAVLFAALFLAPSLGIPLLLVLTALIGALEGADGILSRSMGADVIDFDEAQTGERKEGTYYAAWNFTTKLAVGAAVLGVGLSLEMAGFRAGAQQADSSLLAMRLLVSAVPCTLIVIGLVPLLRFRLDEQAHRGLRVDIDQRRGGETWAD